MNPIRNHWKKKRGNSQIFREKICLKREIQDYSSSNRWWVRMLSILSDEDALETVRELLWKGTWSFGQAFRTILPILPSMKIVCLKRMSCWTSFAVWETAWNIPQVLCGPIAQWWMPFWRESMENECKNIPGLLRYLSLMIPTLRRRHPYSIQKTWRHLWEVKSFNILLDGLISQPFNGILNL